MRHQFKHNINGVIDGAITDAGTDEVYNVSALLHPPLTSLYPACISISKYAGRIF